MAYLPCYDDLGKKSKPIVYVPAPDCSGRMKISRLGGREENFAEWSEVYSEKGGNYEMTIFYSCDKNRKTGSFCQWNENSTQRFEQ